MLEAINEGSDVLMVPKGPNVYRAPRSIRFFAPAERDVSFQVLIHQYIALRWSAKQLLGREVYKHLAPLEPDSRLLKLLS